MTETPYRLAALLALLMPALGGCISELRGESAGERCADLINIAFPGGNITVTKTTVTPAPQESLATTLVAVAGERRHLPEDSAAPRAVAIECRFDGGVLTSLRWTAGPLR